MNTLIRLLGMLLISAPLQAAQDIGPQVDALLREQGLQGAVWTTLDAQGAAGLKDARTGAPMRADQRVHVGSVAKTLMAAGILRLVSQRRLSLDAPVTTLLPGIPFDNPWEHGDPVRIRHLLDHTAGLDDARLWHVLSMRAGAGTPLAAAFPAGSRVLRVRHRPGERFSYSNIGYTLLGMVMEAVTQQAYERYLDAALLAPLGMHDSSFAFVAQDRDPRLAMGHLEDGVTHPAVPSYVRPASQFTTTAADMGRFARFLMSDGRLAGTSFIDPALLRQMGEPAGTEAARAGLSVGYALGLRRYDVHGAIAKCHGGNTVGFRARMCLFPETQQAFFIAINTDSETADYARFDALLTRTLMAAAPVPALSPAPRFASQAWEGWYIPSPNRFDSLRFIDTAFNFMHVGRDGQALTLDTLQAAPVKLHHVEGALFRAPGKQRASHALLISPTGARVISNGIQSYEQVALTRLLPLWLSVIAGMLGLAWLAVHGLVRLAMRRVALRDGLLLPCAGVLALLLPMPFFYRQSFVQLGDVTLASGLLAAVTAALPLAMLVGLGVALRRNTLRSAASLAMLAVLQLSLVLAAWDLLPLRLWV